MPKLPHISGREAIQALKQLGFSVVRQRGSHVVLKKDSNPAVGCVVPVHNELAIGTLRSVLRQARVSPEDFIANL